MRGRRRANRPGERVEQCAGDRGRGVEPRVQHVGVDHLVAPAEIVELDSDRVEKGTAVESCRHAGILREWRDYIMRRVPVRANTSGDVVYAVGSRIFIRRRGYRW